ncbi:hypothetical protein [Streptomyces olivaceiscleroticus]|uniref:Uncharacterized protein n=1 Tax=Streptomyces olivaceiscleroticus TaxID=68245 RepID=A0ABN0ZP15_9ACTN
MAPQIPTQHARVAADAVERMLRDVRSGRAEWGHQQHVRQTTDDLTRIAEALAGGLQQLAAALGQLHGPQPHPSLGPLHQAGQSMTTAARKLRQARRSMH